MSYQRSRVVVLALIFLNYISDASRSSWPDDLAHEALARLLALNQERAEAERLAGAAVDGREVPAANKRGQQARRGATRTAVVVLERPGLTDLA